MKSKPNAFFRRTLPLFVSLCLLLSSLSACGTTPPPGDLLTRLLSATPSPPSGRLCCLFPQNDGEHPLSDALLASAFGEGSRPVAMDGVEDAACYFSFRSAYEIDLFLCKSSATADAVEEMCLFRLRLLRRLRQEDAAAMALLEQAEVLRHGPWVLLAVTSDPAAIRRAFLHET